jgi:hypothetical protein
MAEEQKQQEPESKPDHYSVVAKNLIGILGGGEDFDKIEGVIKEQLEQAHANGMENATKLPVDMQARQVIALEAIADHLGAFRRAKVDERADVGKMREVLVECRQILRHPRMVASNELIKRIDEVSK